MLGTRLDKKKRLRDISHVIGKQTRENKNYNILNHLKFIEC